MSLVVAEGVKVSEYCAVAPATTVCVVETPAAGANKKSVPVPVRVMDCGLFKPSSMMSMRVWFVPGEVGA